MSSDPRLNKDYIDAMKARVDFLKALNDLVDTKPPFTPKKEIKKTLKLINSKSKNEMIKGLKFITTHLIHSYTIYMQAFEGHVLDLWEPFREIQKMATQNQPVTKWELQFYDVWIKSKEKRDKFITNVVIYHEKNILPEIQEILNISTNQEVIDKWNLFLLFWKYISQINELSQGNDEFKNINQITEIQDSFYDEAKKLKKI